MNHVIVDLVKNINYVMEKSKPLIKAAVAVIFEQDSNTSEKVLLSKRLAHQSYPGYWEFPGGKIEIDETADNAIVRELKEELNIVINNYSYRGDVNYSYPKFDVILSVYQINEYSGTPIGNEGQDICWHNLSDISEINPILPASFDIIKLL